jgi:hypothetical protein
MNEQTLAGPFITPGIPEAELEEIMRTLTLLDIIANKPLVAFVALTV